MTVATLSPAHESAWVGGRLDPDGQRQLTMREALAESGLDWEVRKVPVQALVEPNTNKLVTVPGRYAVVRSTDNHPFGVVGKTWQPTQNIAGFQLVDELLQIAGNDKPVWIENALPLQGGKKVIIMVRLDLGLQIAGEDYHSYLSFVNGHDGRCSVMALAHDSRYVCANGQIGALMGAGKLTTTAVRVRHTKNAGAKIKAAVQILGMRNKAAEDLAKQGEWLCEQSISDAEFDGFLESLLPIKEDQEDKPAGTMTRERRTKIATTYANAENLDAIRGTRWGAFQAVLEYADHGREFKSDDTQIVSQMNLTPQPIKVAALHILNDKRLRPLVKA